MLLQRKKSGLQKNFICCYDDFIVPHGEPMRKPRVQARGLFFYRTCMSRLRVISLIDGINFAPDNVGTSVGP